MSTVVKNTFSAHTDAVVARAQGDSTEEMFNGADDCENDFSSALAIAALLNSSESLEAPERVSGTGCSEDDRGASDEDHGVDQDQQDFNQDADQDEAQNQGGEAVRSGVRCHCLTWTRCHYFFLCLLVFGASRIATTATRPMSWCTRSGRARCVTPFSV